MSDPISDAIDRLTDITAAIAAHKHRGRYDAEQLLDEIEGQVREARKLLEVIEDPAG